MSGAVSTTPIGPGRERQSAIYRAGVLGRRPAVPADFASLEAAARRSSSARAWAYVAGGAGEGRTMRNNRSAFDRWVNVPRMAHGISARELATTVLGTTLPAPLLLAPIGAAALMRRDSDLAIARAAAATGVPYVFSNQGCNPMEDCAAAMGDAARWVQLYWSTDEELVDSFLRRAERIGAGALVVTLDTTLLGWRPRDLNLGSLPFARAEGIAQYTSDPRFLALAAARKSPASKTTVTLGALRTLAAMARNYPGSFWSNLRSRSPRAAVETFLDIYSNPGLSWDHLATLRSRTRLPIVLKGILHPDDARRAFDDLGVDAIVVSNHGGRQVDNSIAALNALIEVRDAVGPDRTVLFDSGIRTGADVFTALALGADAVLLGRPYVYGLAIAGELGVTEVIRNVVAELDLTMALTGVRRVADIDRSLLRPA
jgi:lactate 2-monooxygenase